MKKNWTSTNFDINIKTKYIICCNFKEDNKVANIGFLTLPNKVRGYVGVWKIKTLKQ